MQGLFGGAIGYAHGAAPQFPERTIFPPGDLEVVEKSGGFGWNWLLRVIQPGAQQTRKTNTFRT